MVIVVTEKDFPDTRCEKISFATHVKSYNFSMKPWKHREI